MEAKKTKQGSSIIQTSLEDSDKCELNNMNNNNNCMNNNNENEIAIDSNIEHEQKSQRNLGEYFYSAFIMSTDVIKYRNFIPIFFPGSSSSYFKFQKVFETISWQFKRQLKNICQHNK